MRRHPFYGHSKDKGLKTSNSWVLDSLISRQTKSLSIWLQVNLLTLKVAKYNTVGKCHHMRLFYVALARQTVG